MQEGVPQASIVVLQLFLLNFNNLFLAGLQRGLLSITPSLVTLSRIGYLCIRHFLLRNMIFKCVKQSLSIQKAPKRIKEEG